MGVLCAFEKLYNFVAGPLYLWFHILRLNQPTTYPGEPLYILIEKKSMYKWIHVVQTHVIQGSTAIDKTQQITVNPQ